MSDKKEIMPIRYSMKENVSQKLYFRQNLPSIVMITNCYQYVRTQGIKFL